MIPFLRTLEGVSVYINGEPFEVPQSAPHFSEVTDLLKSGLSDNEVATQIRDVITRVLRKVQSVNTTTAETGVEFRDGVVYYNGQPLHNSITDRMIRMFDEGFDIEPLVRFLENLLKNPSFRVVNNLYDFLEYGQIPITDDGHFLAYKAIRSDWKDIHSGSIDNSIGKVVEVPRNSVDENPERTCSHGLHVCSWSYLPHFAHRGGRVVIVKVNPADVVAIPADYNNTKMRCSRYEVVSEYADYYAKDPHNLLSSRSVFAADQFAPGDFELEDEIDASQHHWHLN